MGAVARNALKGYVYQQYIFTLFLAKMDTERSISKIESEAIGTAKFDDLYIVDSGEEYRIQIKNYKDTTLSDIEVGNDVFTIGSNKNKYNPKEKNIVVINTANIETKIKFMGFDAVEINGIIVIPLLESKVADLLDSMFSMVSRELQIINYSFILTSKSQFVVSLEDLPKLIRLSTDLENKTILVRETLEICAPGIIHIVGKPGVGKSHYVTELANKYKDALIYRFWIGSQDADSRNRMSFDYFLNDLALAVFKSSKSYTMDELVNKINHNEFMIIIDGLDHIENYNPLELERYIDFIDRIGGGNIVVLSRPLKANTNWNKIELENWSYEETALYLASAHEIYETENAYNIYTASNGYPIITYFLAENYKLYGEVNSDCKVESIEEYYDKLLQDVKVRSALTLFATNNSFFLTNEIDLLLDGELAYVVKEFVDSYPYLFKQVMNRISLIHDSFNTYLRRQLVVYPERKKSVTKSVKKSILSGEIRYMHRMTSFDYDEDFYDSVLLKYCEFAELEALLSKTLDYNSISSFYNQLQKLLEERENLYDINQYYSFVLIHQIVNRNNLKGFEGLIYQLLIYIDNHGNIEEEIFSTGTIWNVYTLSKNESEIKKYRENKLSVFDSSYEVYKNLDEELAFFEKESKRINFEELAPLLSGTELYQNDKIELLTRYLISAWINEEKDELYDVFKLYIDGDETVALNKLQTLVSSYNIEKIWMDGILSRTKYQLYELGYFEDKNIFKHTTLQKLICSQAPYGSFQTIDYVKSFVRFNNHKKMDIENIYMVNYVWSMYYMRKDYSVITINDALRTFEENMLIDEMQSLEIIKRLMQQSEKGIRGLMVEYINDKPIDFTKKLIMLKYFNDDCPAYIFDLSPERISLFDENVVMSNFFDLIKYHMQGKTIEYRDINNLLESIYADKVLAFLSRMEFSILGNVTDKNILDRINGYGIRCIGETNPNVEEYIPFEHGYIHREDKEYIIENNVPYMELVRYTDGWHYCMPYVDLYQHYDQSLVRNDYLKIIHGSIFAKTPKHRNIGAWDFLLGNIPSFLQQTRVDIDWERLFGIFKAFLRNSMIYAGD